MSTATLTSKGQTTIPKEIRERVGLKAGDKLTFYIDEHNRIVVEPQSIDFGELYGMLAEPGKPPVSIEEMDEAIGSEVQSRL